MEKNASNTDELKKKLTLLKVELAKKKSKLEKQKRFAKSRKKRLESANYSNCNDTEHIVRPESSKTVKFKDDASATQVCNDNFEDGLFTNAQLTTHEQCLSIDESESNIKDTSIVSKSSDNALETDSNELDNRVSQVIPVIVSDEISKRNFNLLEINKNQSLFRQDEEINNVYRAATEGFRPSLNLLCRPTDSQQKQRPTIRTVLTETVYIKIENGIVLFCDCSNDTLLVVQQNITSLFSMDVNGDWTVVHEYLHKENWCFRGGHYNDRENVFIELSENSESCGVQFWILNYSAKETWQMRSTMLATFPAIPLMTIHCFSDHNFAFGYQLELESTTHILSLDFQEEKVNNMADLEDRITSVHFLNAPGYKEELLLACSDVGKCFLYNVYGVHLQSYKLPLLTDPCLLVNLEKNIIFLVIGHGTEKKLVLAALNILTKQYRVLQDYHLTSTDSVTDQIVFIKYKQLVALGKYGFTAWDIKSGELSSAWELIEPGTSLLQKNIIFFVNDKGDSVKMLSLKFE